MTRGGESGTVLMEYAVVCCFVCVVVLAFLQKAVYVDGAAVSGFFNFDEGYVGLGADWADSVRRLHRAIALPVP